MADYTELKRLAEAFPADLDWDSNTEPFFNGPSGESLGGGATGFYSVYGKPFRLEGEDYDYDGPTYVEACPADFAKFMVAARDGVLALIAENESLRGSCKAMGSDMGKLTRERNAFRAKSENLQAENAGLQTGYKAYEQVNAELRAEVEKLRKLATELRGSAECNNVHHCTAEQHDLDEPCKVLARIDAAMGQGEQP